MNISTIIQSGGNVNRTIPMLVMSGESNSGGQVPIGSASAGELQPRPALQIYNPTTQVFETMQLGVNNLIDHFGLTDNTVMSWENELANLASAATIKNPTYLVKTGQGGSTIAQWNTGGTYSNKFIARVDTALSFLPATTGAKFALLYSQGINDRVSGSWNAATWKAATIARFNYLRSVYGLFPIVMTKFMYPFADIDAVIEQICTEVENCFFVNTADLGTLDAYHWDYAGQKTIASRMVDKLRQAGYTL